jgi:beta-glucosidase
VITPLAGLRTYLEPEVEVLYAAGRSLREATTVASMADAVVCIAGYTHSDEGEYVSEMLGIGGDRLHLTLHPEDIGLIEAVTGINADTSVVLIGGSAIMMERWRHGVPAILHAFYVGMEGGTALARILFGEANPSAKLPFTIPTDEDHLPSFDRSAEAVQYDLYHGYTRLDKEGHEPAFAFGFGLSYTTFKLANAAFAVQGDQIEAAVDVTNTGPRAGAQVVQFYVGFENSDWDRPLKLLRGFTRIDLEPGESTKAVITCPVDKLRWYNPESRRWELEEMVYQASIGTSSRAQDRLAGSFTLAGE